ncbi:MAG TPA: hypothetical protein VEI97_10225, partial [bacterium]|nr:hypothetical protein [bacterium]
MARLSQTLKDYLPGANTVFNVGTKEIDLTSEGAAPTRAGEISVHSSRLKYYNGTTAKTLLEAGTETTLNIRPVQLSALDIVSSAALPVLTRASADLWYWERTAAGAETLYFSFVVPYKVETASYGAKLTKVEVAYELATADLTSLDLTVSSVVFAQATNPV